MKIEDRTVFGILLLASVLEVVLGVPFVFAVLSDPDPLKIWLNAGVEFLLFLVPACAVGVWMGEKVDLGPKLLRNLVLGTPGSPRRLLATLAPSVGVGADPRSADALGGGAGLPWSGPG